MFIDYLLCRRRRLAGRKSMNSPTPQQEGSFLVLSMQNHTVSYCTESGNSDALNIELRQAMSAFSGKWKLEILWLLSLRMHRFNELRRALPGVTQHTLTQQLRELERDGMVTRTIHPEVPPRVEYEITEKARGLTPVFQAIFEWAFQNKPPANGIQLAG